MNGMTRVLLVLLRLAIGWHFLFEGLEKLTSDSWTSEAYLREASGPLAPCFWRMAGDRVADELTPAHPDTDPANTPEHEYLPPALAAEWHAYLERFARHYQLTPGQRAEADARLLQEEDNASLWVRGKPPNPPRKSMKSSPYGPPVPVEQTIPDRLREYRERSAEVRTLEGRWLPRTFGTVFAPGDNAKLRADKGEVARLRSELAAEVAQRTEKMKDVLHLVLTAEQKESYGPLPEAGPKWRDWGGWRSWTGLDWVDRLVPLAVTAIGACLLAGLLTRTACVGGALFLLTVVLAMPPLPGVPENPKAEGHYLYVNKNVIETIALLALATTWSGRWAGLDGLVQFFRPGRWRRVPASAGWPPAPRARALA